MSIRNFFTTIPLVLVFALQVLFITCGSTTSDYIPPDDTGNQVRSKYWKYRERLVTSFLKKGSGPGESLPAEARVGPATSEKAEYIRYGDSTTLLGWYIAVLATEYRLLTSPQAAEFAQGAPWANPLENVKTELYYAMNAFQRLDKTAEKSFNYQNPSCTNGKTNVPGFFIRDDVPGSLKSFYKLSNLLSDYSSPSIYNKEASQDQVYHMMLGLALVKKYVGGVTVKGMNLSNKAKEMSANMVAWMSSNLTWTLKNPACNKIVTRGGDAGAYSTGAAKALSFITDGTASPTNPPILSGVWKAAQTSIPPEFENPDNLHMAMVLAAIGNGWGENTMQSLMNLSNKYSWHVYPLVHYVLYDGGSNWAGFLGRINEVVVPMITTAPEEGPRSNGTRGWRAPHKFLKEKHHQYEGPSKKLLTSRYHGLDFMLVHNLFLIAN